MLKLKFNSFKIFFKEFINGKFSWFTKYFIKKIFDKKIRKLFFIKAIFLDFTRNKLNKNDLLLPSSTIIFLKFTLLSKKNSFKIITKFFLNNKTLYTFLNLFA